MGSEHYRGRAKALLTVPLGLVRYRSLSPNLWAAVRSTTKTSHTFQENHPPQSHQPTSTNHERARTGGREDGAMAVAVPGAGGPALPAPPRAGLRAPGRVLPGRAGALRGPPSRRARLPRPLGVPPAARRPLRRLPVRLISFSFSRGLVGQLFFIPSPSPNTFTASSSRGCPSPCSSTPSAPPCAGSGSSATRAPCSGVISSCTCRGR